MLLLVALHAGALHTLSAQSRWLPLYIAFAALIPAISGLERAGALRAAIGFGLVVPLLALLLASPITAPLVLPLVVAAGLAGVDARRAPRALAALLAVALLPALLVALAIAGVPAPWRLDFAAARDRLQMADPRAGLVALAALAPVLVVPVLYGCWRGLPEPRRVASALAVVGLPLFLALAGQMLDPAMSVIVPPLALLAGFVSWLAVVRLPRALRILSIAMLALSAGLSWAPLGIWDDPQWKAALFGLRPDQGAPSRASAGPLGPRGANAMGAAD